MVYTIPTSIDITKQGTFGHLNNVFLATLTGLGVDKVRVLVALTDAVLESLSPPARSTQGTNECSQAS